MRRLFLLPFSLLPLGAAAVTQPIPFSHRKHAGAACTACHATAATGERAGLPAASQCMLCHENLPQDRPALRKLLAYQKEEKSGPKSIPWVRVYRLPDFVFFSHARHLAAKIDCAACHGPLAQQEALLQEVPVKMRTCLDCHRRRGASIACNLCHELGP